MEAGCLIALSEQLKNSANVPEVVLSEVSAAMAVLASDGELCGSLFLCLTGYKLLPLQLWLGSRSWSCMMDTSTRFSSS